MMGSSIRRACLALTLMFLAMIAYATPGATQGSGCYTCLMSCPTSSGEGQGYCEFYCEMEGAEWSCDDDQVCPINWIQLNCWLDPE